MTSSGIRAGEGEAMDLTIQLQTEYIVLASLLKLAGIVGSGGEAKRLIQEGLVSLNGAVDRRRGAKVRAGDRVTLDLDPPVSIRVEAH
jgi:ribosome-associated protein